MTKKFERVLSDDDLLEIATSKGSFIHKNEDGVFIYGEDRFPISRAFLLGMLRAVDVSVQIRLAEQEPVAIVSKETFSNDGTSDIITSNLPIGTPLYTHPCVSPASDKAACVSEKAENETQDSELLKQALESMIDAAHPAYIADDFFRNKLIKARDAAFKALESNRLNAKERHRTTKNHIADASKMVADMYWISDEFSTETILDAFDPIVGMIDVSVGDTFEVRRAKTLPSITVEVTEVAEYGDVEAYKIVGGDHIPDIGQMITPLAQRKIQTLLDKGEYRVIENATVLVNESGHAAIVNHGGAFYWVDNEALAREFDGVGVGVDSHHIADVRKMVDDADEALRKELDLVGLDMGAYSSPKEALVVLIDWHVSVATDPRANGGWQLVPVEPDQALLVSMATCLNHGFGLLTKEKQDGQLYDMRKLYDEVVGKGYYSPKTRERYLAMLAAAPKCTGEK